MHAARCDAPYSCCMVTCMCQGGAVCVHVSAPASGRVFASASHHAPCIVPGPGPGCAQCQRTPAAPPSSRAPRRSSCWRWAMTCSRCCCCTRCTAPCRSARSIACSQAQRVLPCECTQVRIAAKQNTAQHAYSQHACHVIACMNACRVCVLVALLHPTALGVCIQVHRHACDACFGRATATALLAINSGSGSACACLGTTHGWPSWPR